MERVSLGSGGGERSLQRGEEIDGSRDAVRFRPPTLLVCFVQSFRKCEMEVLRLATLCLVRDGKLAAEFDQKMADCFNDCVERPQLEQARTITLQIKIVPNGNDPLDACRTDFAVKSSLPAVVVSRFMKANARRRGLVFESDTDDVSIADGQQALGFEDGDES